MGKLNIKDALTIRQIADIRQDKNDSDERNEDRSKDILSSLYSNNTHFIYELLQNAEDAKAERVCFKLEKDRLIFEHNGTPFTIEDFKAITNIGNSTKRGGQKIGKFGIGFKSVYSISDSPHIYSGEFSVKIINYNVPVEIEDISREKDLTVFIFPIKDAKIFKDIENALRDISLETILFLEKIQSIETNIINIKSRIHKKLTNNFFIEIKKENNFDNSQLQHKQYFYYTNNKKISIVFLMENGRLIKAPNTKINVYFPTEIDSHLNFYINAPFETSPTRESIIKNEASDFNRNLWGFVISCYISCLKKIKELNLVTANFIDILPIDTRDYFTNKVNGKPEFYQNFWTATFDLLKKDNYIPLSDFRLGKTDEIVLSDGFMPELVTTKLLKEIYNKIGFVSSEITLDKMVRLYDYLKKEHNVQEINFESFTRKLTKELLEVLSDEWLTAYYEKASEMEYLINKKNLYREIPIIRTECNDQVFAYIENLPNVYLPSFFKNDNRKCIKQAFLKNELCKKFFELLHIKEADAIQEIESTIEELKELIKILPFDEKRYIDKFEWMNFIYNEIKNDTEKLTNLKDYFKEAKIFLLYDGETFEKSSNCIINSEDNILLYEKVEQIPILSSIFKDMEPFFLQIGVNKNIVLKEQKLPSQKYPKQYTYLNGNKDYALLGFLDLIKNMTHEKSKILFRIFSDNKYKDKFLSSFLCGEIEYFYRSNKNEQPVSQFFDDIQNCTWVMNEKNNKKYSLSDLSKQEFAEINGVERKEIENSLFWRGFNFKSDVYDSLPENDKERLELTKDISTEELRELLENRKEHLLKNKQIDLPLINIDEKKTYLFDDSPLRYNGLKKEEAESHNNDEKNNLVNCKSKNKKSVLDDKGYVSQEYRKKLGLGGEKIVLIHLFEKYEKDGYQVIGEKGKDFSAIKNNSIINVIYKNDGFDTFGYDICIKEDNKVIEYIEVKTKFDSNLIDVSGSQWNFAKFCHMNNQEYNLYIVIVESAKIKAIGNPYTEWTNGNLFATPVQIRID